MNPLNCGCGKKKMVTFALCSKFIFFDSINACV